MIKRLVLAVAVVALVATSSVSGCHLGGSARRQICICKVNGRPTNVPMSLCRLRR
jgi:hypothetical protein